MRDASRGPSPPLPLSDRVVRFGTIEVLTFAGTPGDSPAVGEDLPAAHGDDAAPLERRIATVDGFEAQRCIRRRPRPHLRVLKDERGSIAMAHNSSLEKMLTKRTETHQGRGRSLSIDSSEPGNLMTQGTLSIDRGEGYQSSNALQDWRTQRRQSYPQPAFAAAAPCGVSSLPCRMPERKPSLNDLAESLRATTTERPKAEKILRLNDTMSSKQAHYGAIALARPS